VTLATPSAEPHFPRRGAAVLLHGFSRQPRHLRLLSETLNAAGVATVRPTLSAWDWSHGINNSGYLGEVARRLQRGLPSGPVVVVGHSAGAAAGAWIAAELREYGVDVRRLVMVDGVESPAGLIRRAWPRLASVDVVDVTAEPSRCNREGALVTWLQAQDRRVTITPVPGAGHGDIEGDESAIYRWACGDQSSPQTRAAVLTAVVNAALEGFTPVR
jgi:pimeloyl-ACP methyl ester carboxylesterase